jgi:hypothetical protein
MNSSQDRRAGQVREANATSPPSELANLRALSLVLGRPTDKGITMSVLSADARDRSDWPDQTVRPRPMRSGPPR